MRAVWYGLGRAVMASMKMAMSSRLSSSVEGQEDWYPKCLDSRPQVLGFQMSVAGTGSGGRRWGKEDLLAAGSDQAQVLADLWQQQRADVRSTSPSGHSDLSRRVRGVAQAMGMVSLDMSESCAFENIPGAAGPWICCSPQFQHRCPK